MDTRERLIQIIECGLPVKVKVGNTLPTDKHNRDLDVFGVLERDIPEVKVPGGDVFNYADGYFFDIDRSYAEPLSKSSGGKLLPKNFIRKYRKDKRQKIISSTFIEIHAFYDPRSNYTYYFPLPSRGLMGL